MDILTATDISVSYQGLTALDGVTIRLAEGELVSLIGSNGAGKSSLLAAISGLHRPIGGTVTFAGADITRQPAHRIARAGLALVPEGRRLFSQQTVRANLTLGAYLRRDPQQRQVRQAQVIDLFPILGDRLDTPAGVLSGGEQQMLALGRALMSQPRLLLLDEPSLGIAPKLATQIFDAIRRIRDSGVSILLVEQNLAAALRLSDRIYVVQTGSVILSGTPGELETSPLVRRAYLGM